MTRAEMIEAMCAAWFGGETWADWKRRHPDGGNSAKDMSKVLDAVEPAIRADERERWQYHVQDPVTRITKCSCQWEIGDSACERHPTCQACELVIFAGEPHTTCGTP